MLEGVRMTSEKRFTYIIFIDIDLIYSEWEVQNMYSSREGATRKYLRNTGIG